ncbi:MAG: outer membrane lipoprotein carrier protein LolA, partial [Flavobacteriaceae bacterium]
MKYLILFILIFTSFFAQAQDAQKAKKLLDEVSEKVKSYDNVSIEFRYTVKNIKENISQHSKGNVTISGEKYVSNFLGTTEIFDGKMKYTIIPEDEEIVIESYDPKKGNAFSPSKILTFYTKGYTYTWDKMLLLSGKKIQFIKLKPTDANSQVKEILLGIDNLTKNIYQLIQILKDETRSELSIISFKPNQTLSENHFTFVETKYSNY